MFQVNIHQAKTNLSKLIKKVINGEEVIIAKGNIPLVKMVGLKTQKAQRKIGSAQDSVKIAADFNEPIDDFNDYIK
jgi:antitoxin (DNA-binding transcriptional repressor) of toxin-antitoxin stability system